MAQSKQLAEAFITVKHFLQQQQLTTPNAILRKLTGDEMFARQVDWNKVYFHTKHLNHTGTVFTHAVANLSTVSVAKCHIQVLVVDDLRQTQLGWEAATKVKKPTLFIANCSSLDETKNVRNYVKSLQTTNPSWFIRFDFLNPDEARMTKLEDPQASTQEVLFRLVKEAVAAMELELSSQSTETVTDDQFIEALRTVAANLDISDLVT